MRGVGVLSLVLLALAALAGCIYVPPPGQTPFIIATIAPPTTAVSRTLAPATLMPPITAQPSAAGTLPPVPSTLPSTPASLPPAPTPTPAPTTPSVGTRENPHPLGAEFEIGDWRVTVESVDLDAWDEIRRENQFNTPPAPGRQFVMFGVAATYEGAETGNAWLDLRFNIVGAGGNTYGSSMDDYCGVIPDSLSNENEQFPGSTVRGNECIAVDIDQIDGATLSVEAGFLNDERIFIALE